MRPAIVLSAHTPALGVIRALGEMGVPVVAVSYRREDVGQVSKYVDEVITAPHPDCDEKRFIEQLLGAGSRLPGALVVPASDETVVVTSRHKSELETYFKVACPPWSIAERIVEKHYTYELAESLGVPIPWTVMPRSVADVERCASEGRLPCLVKPCQSHRYFETFHKKVAPAETVDELATEYRAARARGLEVVLQELIPGDDSHGVNYNAYFWEGEPLVEFTAEKVRLGPPHFGNPCVVVSKRIPEVIEAGRRLLRALNYSGFACTEFKRDPRDGIYKLFEVNGRHNLSTLLAVRAGINFPWLEYRHLMLGERPSAQTYREGLYWIDGTKDWVYLLKAISAGSSLRDILKPYLRQHVFAVLDRRDPRPFLKRVRDQALAVLPGSAPPFPATPQPPAGGGIKPGVAG